MSFEEVCLSPWLLFSPTHGRTVGACLEGKAPPDADADTDWTYAPGAPDSMAEVRKKPKK